MTTSSTLFVLAGALSVEAALGYPQPIYRLVGHPVTWIGALISALDRTFNRENASFGERKMAGVFALLVIVVVPVLIAVLIERLLGLSAFGMIALMLIASTLFASRSLYDHVRDVARALDTGDLTAARLAVGRIVGRNPETLDAHGVARAAIESLAENASDGIVAPVFWFAVLGLPGVVAYKAINTADSMIGHRTPRHEAFGWAAARMDDLVNLPASRLTGLLFALAALFSQTTSCSGAIKAMQRDAKNHRSPNAGWPESAMAGALGLKLNGPKTYGTTFVEDAYMGDGRRDATAGDIYAALRVSVSAWGFMVLAILVLAVILRG
ncbi:cobalamin biosynthesis protein CobD [Hyphomicrobium methylovorum]|uniref:adenosylcobinamide-phosphate synthase CbiB n=1 Tax=Hyphomicrobium methylovorum TaxID=84 RepID=UPI0015E78E84|nr:adenosylcobinamide-phosphate synthase CbiB [Hyphomicrobium methylovorum]MBA2126741.1 cobalamin biosynthesis protein CobD [Hyphomicrobium methylovorum]